MTENMKDMNKRIQTDKCKSDLWCEATKEQQALVSQKIALEGRLSAYSKAVYLREQAKIRQQFANMPEQASITAWLARRATMDNERLALVEEKNRVEGELRTLKSSRTVLSAESDPRHVQMELLRAILIELREIKNLIKHQKGA